MTLPPLPDATRYYDGMDAYDEGVKDGTAEERAKCRARCRELIVRAIIEWDEHWGGVLQSIHPRVPELQVEAEAIADRLLEADAKGEG